MCVTALLSDAAEKPEDAASIARIPGALRAHGRLRFEALGADTHTIPGRIEEAGPIRVRFPRSGRHSGALEAVLLNTGGGMAGGDTAAFEFRARSGARLTATTQAAEKIYRSDGLSTRIDVCLLVEAGARLDWMPQATILFDGARVERGISAEVAPQARLLLVEPVVLGRTARGERFARGRLTDRWRIRRGGRLVYADGLNLDGEVGSVLDRRAVAKGWPAFATVLLIAPDAETRLEAVRAALGLPDDLPENIEAGVSAWDGMLSVRLLARDGAVLDTALRAVIGQLGVAELPRIWHS